MTNFSTVEEMDQAVSNHIYHHASKLPESNRKILRVIAAHAFTPIGTCRLKIATISTEAECSSVTVNRAIKRLKELGIISVEQGTKLNGIQGANFYSILNFTHEVIEQVQPRKMKERDTHETPRSSKVQHTKIDSETVISFNLCSNPFVVKSVENNVSPSATHEDLKPQLRAIYQPQSVVGNTVFEELCGIAFGRLKQGLNKGVPYMQMVQIVVKAMHDLVRKQNVKNQFAMYSAMIKRQVEQLFEQPIRPQSVQSVQRTEVVPEWFNNRNKPSTVIEEDIDFEAERAKILAKLG